MEKQPLSWTLGELAGVLGGALDGPNELRIERPAPADANDPAAIGFAESEEYLRKAERSGIGALIVSPGAETSKPAIRVERPRESFARFLALCARPLPSQPGIDPRAVVSPEANVHPSARVGAFAVVERGARLEAEVRVYPFCYVGENCRLGPGAVLYPHVVLYQDVTLGPGAVVHAGAILGADGFGYVWDGERQVKIPQVGGVRIGEEVEIGALSAVDRATLGQTEIAAGAKLDNLVQVGHNSRIGAHTVVASQTGISGSTVIGERVTIGGQVATSDHVRVADGVTLAGRTGVTKSLDEPGVYWGLPAAPITETMRVMALQRRLPELVSRLRSLERRLEDLEKAEEL